MNDADFFVVKQYLMRSIARPGFWQGISLEQKNKSVTSLHQLPDDKAQWLDWIADNLQPEQQQKLNASVRKSRMRQKGKDITVSDEAHRILVALSDNGRLSFSQVIEQKLNRAYLNAIRKDK